MDAKAPHPLSAIDHVGIAVPDLDDAIEFYRESFGFELRHVEVNEDQGTHEAMLRAPGDDGTGTAIQLLAPLGPDSTIAKFLERKGPGVQQVALRVSDIVETADDLRGKGLKVLWDDPRPGTSNSKANFVHPKSTGGVLLELVEPGDKPA